LISIQVEIDMPA